MRDIRNDLSKTVKIDGRRAAQPEHWEGPSAAPKKAQSKMFEIESGTR